MGQPAFSPTNSLSIHRRGGEQGRASAWARQPRGLASGRHNRGRRHPREGRTADVLAQSTAPGG